MARDSTAWLLSLWLIATGAASSAQGDDPDTLMKQGFALAREGRSGDAIRPMERALELLEGIFRLTASAEASTSARWASADKSAVKKTEATKADATNPQTEAARALTSRLSSGWYALGQVYNDIGREAMSTLEDDPAWRSLLVADALLQNRRFTDAFALYRDALERLPAMISIHDAIADIYASTGHGDWAVMERARGTIASDGCAARRALCEFRAGRPRAALAAALAADDPESRYWRARAATELALSAFKRVESLPDSRERRGVRAAAARAEERYTDAIAELQAALTFAPADPALLYDLASAYYAARDFEAAMATTGSMLERARDDPRLTKMMGFSLLQLRRAEEAVAILTRVLELDPSDAGVQLALGRAHLQSGNFAAAIPLIEEHLARDQDGSLHVQLARAYAGLERKERSAELLARSQILQRAADARNAAAARRTITPPK